MKLKQLLFLELTCWAETIAAVARTVKTEEKRILHKEETEGMEDKDSRNASALVGF
jgi:hypothetical protein